MAEQPHVLVVGGGSTGCGVARDLALRGLRVTLVERGALASGTTGRTHGVLHSGGRYAVADPDSARDCIAENRVLRDVATHCIEATGGLFLERAADSEEYFEEKVRGCEACSIPTEVLSGAAAREREPQLATDIDRAIAVPDGVVDPVRLCVANARAAESRGARIETHTEVTDVLVETGEVVGVEVRHTSGTTERIEADHVVNATGAWAGQFARLAGIDIGMSPSKGAMTVVDGRHVDTVLNLCAPKGEADIVVPNSESCVLGTTDIRVDDPEEFPRADREVDLLVEELSTLVPALREAPTVRSYWGVRPLYEPPEAETDEPTDIARDFFVLDHAERDATPGLTTVVGGKLTTYRLMAEETSDHVCDRLGVSGTCRTAERPLPGSDEPGALEDAIERFGTSPPAVVRGGE